MAWRSSHHPKDDDASEDEMNLNGLTRGWRARVAHEMTVLPNRLPVQREWLRRIGWHVSIAATVATAGLVMFAKVGEDVFQHESGSVDDMTRRWILAHQVPSLFTIFTWITNAGSSIPVAALTALVGIWLWRSRGRRAASGALVAPLLAHALFNILKVTYGRVRPIGALHFGLHTFAFPSGHATVSMSVLPTVAYVLWRERVMSGPRLMLVTALAVLLIGASRVYLDVHWLTDVLGGWAVGVFVSGLAVATYEHLRREPALEMTNVASDQAHDGAVTPVDALAAEKGRR